MRQARRASSAHASGVAIYSRPQYFKYNLLGFYRTIIVKSFSNAFATACTLGNSHNIRVSSYRVSFLNPYGVSLSADWPGKPISKVMTTSAIHIMLVLYIRACAGDAASGGRIEQRMVGD
jgi:hypothetical protein